MAKDGVSIKQIVRQTGHSRNTVRQVIRGARADVFRSRMKTIWADLDPGPWAPIFSSTIKA
jgi:hypothetical protein